MSTDYNIPRGRVMTDALCEEKANEILDLLKMWGVSLADTYVIARNMKYICQNTHVDKWKNPLEGTGLNAEGFIRAENIVAKPEKFEFDS